MVQPPQACDAKLTVERLKLLQASATKSKSRATTAVTAIAICPWKSRPIRTGRNSKFEYLSGDRNGRYDARAVPGRSGRLMLFPEADDLFIAVAGCNIGARDRSDQRRRSQGIDVVDGGTK